MASTKLSTEDRQAIVKLYQEVGQTAATVAEQYGVSVSTISRLLKSELPAETYEALVRQKRGGGETKSKKRASRKKPISKLKKSTAEPKAAKPEATDPAATEPEVVEPESAGVDADVEPTSDVSEETEKAPTRSRRRRTRSSSEKKRPVSRRKTKEPEEAPVVEVEEEVITEDPTPEVIEVAAAVEPEETSAGRQKPVRRTRPRLKRTVEAKDMGENTTSDGESEAAEAAGTEAPEESKPRRRTRRRTRSRTVVEEASEVVEVETEDDAATFVTSEENDGTLALDDLTETLDSEDEGFDDAFDDDDLGEDEDDGSDNITSLRRRSAGADVVQIQPLSEANLSRMLYLVIDRTADLITMPMVFFSDLGELPEEEEKKKTLPVFENHRVARRFSQRNQRVIKVPDGELISKTAPWLEAKGITRCLLDGQVYSLESSEH